MNVGPLHTNVATCRTENYDDNDDDDDPDDGDDDDDNNTESFRRAWQRR